MASEDEANERYGAELAGKLVACGVPASSISVRYEDVIRDYEIVISGGPLTLTQIECIDAALYRRAICSSLTAAMRLSIKRFSHVDTGFT